MPTAHVTLAAVLLVGCTPTQTHSPAAQVISGKVVSIADGDTVTVLVERQQVRVRVWGVDAPEREQPFGTRAKQAAGELAFGRVVDVEVHDTDRYGRKVGKVKLPDGRDLGAEMIRAGLAWWYRHYAPGEAPYRELEAEARKAKRGLWAEPNPVAPWEWRTIQRARASGKREATGRNPP